MEPLLPLMLPMGIWDPFIAVGSAIMQPLYWVVSGILVLFHTLWSPVFGPVQPPSCISQRGIVKCSSVTIGASPRSRQPSTIRR